MYRGAKKSLLPAEATGILGPDHQYFHGKNGFGDVPLPQIDNLPRIQSENAIVALQRITSNNEFKGTLEAFS